MKVTRWQLRTAVCGLEQDIDLCRAVNARVDPRLRDVLQQFKDLLLMSSPGQECEGAAEQLEQNTKMDAKAVAVELGCTRRHVSRIAKDLDGRLCECGASWVFDRQNVLDYACSKGEADDRS